MPPKTQKVYKANQPKKSVYKLTHLNKNQTTITMNNKFVKFYRLILIFKFNLKLRNS